MITGYQEIFNNVVKPVEKALVIYNHTYFSCFPFFGFLPAMSWLKFLNTMKLFILADYVCYNKHNVLRFC